MPHELNPKQGEIWGVTLDPISGSEQGGNPPGAGRPVLVVSAARKGRPSVRVCVPLTTFQNPHALLRWMALLAPNATNGLKNSSSADASQIRALDVQRFGARWGKVSETELSAVFAALDACLGRAPNPL